MDPLSAFAVEVVLGGRGLLASARHPLSSFAVEVMAVGLGRGLGFLTN
jgi:NAD kinase